MVSERVNEMGAVLGLNVLGVHQLLPFIDKIVLWSLSDGH
jgi:hypothetical protein